MRKENKSQRTNRNSYKLEKNECSSNLKYLSRCYYYGKLKDYEYVSGALVLLLQVYTATEFFGGSNIIRLYVPTSIEQGILRELIIGDDYFAIAAPYKLCFQQSYRFRVDLLLNLFKEV